MPSQVTRSEAMTDYLRFADVAYCTRFSLSFLLAIIGEAERNY